MLKRAATTVLTLIATFVLFGQSAEAQASYSSLADYYYDYDLYYGVRQTVYDLYVVYDDGSEELYHTYTSTSQLSNQMYAFAEGKTPSGVVDWYYVRGTAVVNWYFYSNYATRAQAESNADWLNAIGYETDIQLVYNPRYSTNSLNLKLR